MSDTITRDLPLNWRRARSLPALPSVVEILERGQDPHTKFNVLIERDAVDELYDVRDWLQDNNMRYRMFARIGLEQQQWQPRRSLLGLNFVFEKMTDAVLFTLRWVGGRCARPNVAMAAA